jgi:hypothetical protein
MSARLGSGSARAVAMALVRLSLVLAIFIGSLALWIGVPLACAWIITWLISDTTAAALSLVPVCPLAMCAFGVLLAKVNGVYLWVSGSHPNQRRAAWTMSLSGDRAPRQGRQVLEVSLVVSALLAIVALCVWFVFLARNSVPMAPGGF